MIRQDLLSVIQENITKRFKKILEDESLDAMKLFNGCGKLCGKRRVCLNFVWKIQDMFGYSFIYLFTYLFIYLFMHLFIY